ncbi:MAG: HAD family hydrolase [Pirellula sp.]|jgi:phosphoglycolate phosphatase|nr:HAD family hydrolase [Pirellula sp.]
MRFRGVIFDLDGTLLDSIADIGTAANRVLEELGKPTHPIPAYQFLVGDGVSVLFQRALPQTIADHALMSQCIKLFEEAYSEEWNKRSKPYNGIPILLNSLLEARLRVGILSNKPEEFTIRCSNYFFPNVPFDLVVGHSDRFPRKPDPASACWMAQQWEVDSNRIAYVGDTNTDMKTAVGAGFFAIGVTWGFRPESELREHGAMQLVHSATELQDFLLGA